MKRCLVLVLVLIMMGVPAMAECVLDSDWTDRTFVLGDTGYTLVLPEGVEPTEPDEESGRAYAVNESFENSEGGFAVYVGFYPGEEFDAYYEASRKEAIESFAETEWIVLENPDSLMWQMSAASGQPYVRLIDGMSRVFPEEVRYIYVEMMEGYTIGMIAEVIFPTEDGVWTVEYLVTADYMDTMDNLLAGTIAFEE